MARLALVQPAEPEHRRGGARRGEPRRDNHTGSVTRRTRKGKVQWVARWPVPPEVRACGWVERVAPSEREAKAKLKELRREHEHGVFTPGGEQPLAAYLDWWLDTSVRPHRTPKTVVGYETNVRRHIVPRLGEVALARLARADVQRLVNELAAAGLAARTVRYAHATLRAALTDAVDDGLVAANVAARVKLPAIAKQEARALTEEQVGLLLAAVRGHRLEALYALVLALGPREGELCGLRWRDVDLARGRLTIAEQIYRADGRLHTRPTKGHRSRPLVLPPVIVEALRRHRERQAEERLLADDRWEEHGLAFPSGRGTPLQPRNLLRHFQETIARINTRREEEARRAGVAPPAPLPRWTFHELRHTAASLMLARGVPLKVVQEILGHRQLSLTADTYSHLYDSAREDAAARMDELLRRLAGASPDDGEGQERER
jgi:integrase